MEQDALDRGAGQSTTQGFPVLSQKTLPYPARHGLVAWSPQLDLIALVTANENVLLYRINGQRVWGFAHKKDANGDENPIEKLQWRPDGKMLALGYRDGSTRIHDVNNGKAIHHIVSELPSFGSVTCVGWVDNHSHTISSSHPLESKSTECTPQAMFDLDVGPMLPRLSVLPSSSGSESAFTSKTTLDALINAVAKGGEGSHLDVLLIGEESGKILLNVFNSFVIGTMELSSLSHHLKPKSRLIRHTASSDLSTHSLLISEYETGSLLFSTMDILFVQQFGQYLFQLASTSTRVQALLRYIRETVAALEAEFKAINDLGQRYISIIDEDVAKIGSEVGLEFFELLVTGIPSPTLKEWLVDTLTERGQKRWERSSTTGYETLRRLVHENLLPACERLTVLFCRLRGLARWKERGSPLGLEPDDFTRCLDVLSGLTLFAHEFLLKLNKELDLFTVFTNWLRYALDQLSTVINIDDKPPEDPQIDTLKVAEYVEHNLKQSSLLPFFQKGPGRKLSEYKQMGESISELYSARGKAFNLPGFMDLAEYLEELCKTVFAKPQQAMRQQLRVGKPLLIREGGVVKHDIRMVTVEVDKSVAYLALKLQEDTGDSLVLLRCEIALSGGLSSISKIGCAKISISHDVERVLVDVQFVDDKLLLVILQHQSCTTLDGIGHKLMLAAARNSEMLTLEYPTLIYDESYGSEDGHLSRSVVSFAKTLAGQEIVAVSRREFDSTFVPAQVTVNGRTERRVGCVIAEDRLRYQVFDIDAQQEDGDEESMEVDVTE